MSREAEEIAADGLDIDWDLGGGLDGIGVEPDVGVLGDLSYFLDRLDDSSLIVVHHNADKAGVRSESAADLFGINAAAGGDRQEADVDAARGETLGGVEDGVVLYR